MADRAHELVESVATAGAQSLVVPAPMVERWFDFAHTLNGYALAEELGVDLGAMSERLWSGYRETGRWAGTLLELRMVLFHAARAIRFVGGLDEDPRYLADIAALLNAIAVSDDVRWQNGPEPPDGAPGVFRAWIGDDRGPSFEVEWVTGRLVYQASGAWRELGLPTESAMLLRRATGRPAPPSRPDPLSCRQGSSHGRSAHPRLSGDPSRCLGGAHRILDLAMAADGGSEDRRDSSW